MHYKQHIDTLLIELCSSYLGFGLSVHSIQGEKIKEKVKKVDENEVVRLIKEQEDKNLEISALKVELETTKRTYEVQFSQMEEEANSFKAALTRKVQEYEHQLEELRNEVKVSYFAQTTIYWYTMREKTRPRGFS